MLVRHVEPMGRCRSIEAALRVLATAPAIPQRRIHGSA